MSGKNSVDIVHAFRDEVWNAHDPAAADRFVVDDFVIVTGGETISGRENFKKWIEGFLAKLTDLHLEVIESFQNAHRGVGRARGRKAADQLGRAGVVGAVSAA